MKYCKSNLFSIFLIIVAILLLIAISGLVFRAVKQSNIYEGFDSSSSETPTTIPANFVVRPGDTSWKSKIENNNQTMDSTVSPWSPDGQFLSVTTGGNEIGNQFNYFAQYWLNVTGATSGQTTVWSNSYGNKPNNPFQNLGPYSFSVTTSGGTNTYKGTFNPPNYSGTTTWTWSTPTPKPVSKAQVNKGPDGNRYRACIPTNSDGSFTYPAANDGTKPDPNYIYGGYSNTPYTGESTFDQGTENYYQNVDPNFWRDDGNPNDINQYATYAPMSSTLVPVGTDCSEAYSCPPNNMNTSGNCLSPPTPPPLPSGCPAGCAAPKDPTNPGGNQDPTITCKYDKIKDIYNCSQLCINPAAGGCSTDTDCSNCPIVPVTWKQPNHRASDNPYTKGGCKKNCRKVTNSKLDQRYLINVLKLYYGGDYMDGACKIMPSPNSKDSGRMICKPITKVNNPAASGSTGTISGFSECTLCNSAGLQGYIIYSRKWNKKNKDYVYTVTVVDDTIGAGWSSGGGGSGGGSGGGGGGGGASYGPYGGGGDGGNYVGGNGEWGSYGASGS